MVGQGWACSGALSRDRRPYRRPGALERREQPVAGGLEDRPAGLFDGGAQHGVVRGQGDDHRLALLLPEARAPRDVGHEERRGVGFPGLGHEGSVPALHEEEVERASQASLRRRGHRRVRARIRRCEDRHGADVSSPPVQRCLEDLRSPSGCLPVVEGAPPVVGRRAPSGTTMSAARTTQTDPPQTRRSVPGRRPRWPRPRPCARVVREGSGARRFSAAESKVDRGERVADIGFDGRDVRRRSRREESSEAVRIGSRSVTGWRRQVGPFRK